MKEGPILSGASAPSELQATAESPDPTLGSLFGRLTQDGTSLIQQEIGLAKLELKQSATRMAKESAIVAVGAALIGLGLVVLFVFAILALGRLLGGEYWLSTLIVGSVLVAAGGAFILTGKRGLRKSELKPRRTIESLKETGQWAGATAEQMRRDLSQ